MPGREVWFHFPGWRLGPPKPEEADSGDLETPTSPEPMSLAYEVERYKDETG